MLVFLDVGNTNTVIGLFEGDELKVRWRIRTGRGVTSDEYGIFFSELLRTTDFEKKDIEGVGIACVVPPVLPSLIEWSRKSLAVEPMVVSPGIKTGMPIHVDNPREVGADRIVNAVAAYERYKTAVIIVDFGTATTIDFVSSRGVFEGGIIAPGMAISTEALFKSASKLPRVELMRPPRVIGKNTVNAMQSGIVFGYAGLVDALVGRIKKEVSLEWPDEPDPVVVASGGLSSLFSEVAETIGEIDEFLTLQGLRIIYARNRQE